MFGADKALVQMNYRHALDSVEGLSDPKDLDARLERGHPHGRCDVSKGRRMASERRRRHRHRDQVPRYGRGRP